MKSLLIERVSNGWIVRPYGSGVRDDHTQACVFNTLAAMVEALPILLIDPVTQGPPGIQMDTKPQWHADKSPPTNLAAKTNYLFNCPDCGKYMYHADLDTWSCVKCNTIWRCTHLAPAQSSAGPEK